MRKLLTLAAIAGLSLAMLGCGETPAPSTPPATPPVTKPADSSTPAPGTETPAAPGGETPAPPATPPGEGAKP